MPRRLSGENFGPLGAVGGFVAFFGGLAVAVKYGGVLGALGTGRYRCVNYYRCWPCCSRAEMFAEGVEKL